MQHVNGTLLDHVSSTELMVGIVIAFMIIKEVLPIIKRLRDGDEEEDMVKYLFRREKDREAVEKYKAKRGKNGE